MPKEAVFVATCVIAALGSAIMGLYANYPIALAPGMGLNAYFAYGVVQHMGFTWQAALGAVFVSGCLFLLVTLFRIRELIIRGIPLSLRYAITVGIGLFLALIALKSAGIVAASPATYVTLGDLHQPAAVLAVLGWLLVGVLDRLKVPGAIPDRHRGCDAGQLLLRRQRVQGRGVGAAVHRAHAAAAGHQGRAGRRHPERDLVFFLVELFDATGTLMGAAYSGAISRQYVECRRYRSGTAGAETDDGDAPLYAFTNRGRRY